MQTKPSAVRKQLDYGVICTEGWGVIARRPNNVTANERDEMILNQGKLAGGLADELIAVIRKYDETIYMSTAIGVLELVKQQLIQENVEDDDE